LEKIPGIICKKPEGAFYIVAKLPIKDAEDFIIWLLEHYQINGETVMAAPAEGFMPLPAWAETSCAWPTFSARMISPEPCRFSVAAWKNIKEYKDRCSNQLLKLCWKA
jgi:hypothetical protein